MGTEALFAGEGGACSLTKGHCFTLQCAHRLPSLAGVSRSHLLSAGPSQGFQEQVPAHEPVSLGPQEEGGEVGGSGSVWQLSVARAKSFNLRAAPSPTPPPVSPLLSGTRRNN